MGEGVGKERRVEPAAGTEAAGDAMQLDGENTAARVEAAGDIQLPTKDTQEGEAGVGSPQDQPGDKGDASSDDDKDKKKKKKDKKKKDKKEKKKKARRKTRRKRREQKAAMTMMRRKKVRINRWSRPFSARHNQTRTLDA